MRESLRNLQAENNQKSNSESIAESIPISVFSEVDGVNEWINA